MSRHDKTVERWHSPRVGEPVTLARWGWWGTPVLVFPTAGGDAEEIERFLMLDALRSLLDAGRIKVYSVDSIAGRAWMERRGTPEERAALQNRFDAMIAEEVVPAIRHDCRSDSIELVTAGASIGAYNALAAASRHPDLFRCAICMSGTYDLSPWMGGRHTADLHFASPLHFVPHLGEGPMLDRLRSRMFILPTGLGRYEDPRESWRVAEALGARGIPNRVDEWGPEWDHDWVTWRAMLPGYLAAVC